MALKIPDELKSSVPQNTWGKVLAATPVIMTVIATLLAGLASSEMTRAQYDRSSAAQLQNKASDEWGFFQAKKMRGAMQINSLELLQQVTAVPPLNGDAIKSFAHNPGFDPKLKPVLSELLDSADGTQALGALERNKLPVPPPAIALDPGLKAFIEAMENGSPEAEIELLAAKVKPTVIEDALAAATDEGHKFDAVIKPLNSTIDHLNDMISTAPGLGTQRQAFAAARLRFTATRYDAEAQLDQTIGYLYELKVRKSNATAEHHHARSQKFFYGMLGAQAAVIIATFAMASRQRNILWSLAAMAGLIAVTLAIYVYFYF